MCTKVSAVCYRIPRHRSWHMRRRWHCFAHPESAPMGSACHECVRPPCAPPGASGHQSRVHFVRRCSVTQRAARVGRWSQTGPSAFPGSTRHGDMMPRALPDVRRAHHLFDQDHRSWCLQCANGAPEDGLRLPWFLLEFSYFEIAGWLKAKKLSHSVANNKRSTLDGQTLIVNSP